MQNMSGVRQGIIRHITSRTVTSSQVTRAHPRHPPVVFMVVEACAVEDSVRVTPPAAVSAKMVVDED